MSTTNSELRIAIANLGSGLRMLDGALGHLRNHLLNISEPGWKLTEDGWLLVDPERNRLRLAARERALLLALARHPARQMKRQALMRAIGSGADPDDSGASLSVLISRLRKKAAQDRINLPLRAVRGKGYALSVEIETPSSSAASNARAHTETPSRPGRAA